MANSFGNVATTICLPVEDAAARCPMKCFFSISSGRLAAGPRFNEEPLYDFRRISSFICHPHLAHLCLAPDAQRHFSIGAQIGSYRPKTPFL